MSKAKKENKQNKQKLIKEENEDTNVVKKFIIILVLVAGISCLLYFLTAKYIVKDEFQESSESTEDVTITYDTINVGNIFNRPDNDYLVLIYDSKADDASYYSSLFTSYSGESNSKKIYKLDLSLKVNSKYKGDTSNKKATKVSELKLKSPTLIEIKSGKISKYYDTKEEIDNILG